MNTSAIVRPSSSFASSGPGRHVVGERPLGDDDARRVLGGVAEEPLQAERQVEEAPLALAAVAQLAQTRLHLESLLEREVLPLLRLRVELRDAVGLREGE